MELTRAGGRKTSVNFQSSVNLISTVLRVIRSIKFRSIKKFVFEKFVSQNIDGNASNNGFGRNFLAAEGGKS